MNKFVDCSKVYIGESKYGLGVFAKQNFKIDEVIEVGIMTPLTNIDGNENPHVFIWSEDKTIWAVGSGLLPFYNHFDNPNIKKVGDLKNNTMKIIALKNIKKNEELGNSYYSKKWRICFQNF